MAVLIVGLPREVSQLVERAIPETQLLLFRGRTHGGEGLEQLPDVATLLIDNFVEEALEAGGTRAVVLPYGRPPTTVQAHLRSLEAEPDFNVEVIEPRAGAGGWPSAGNGQQFERELVGALLDELGYRDLDRELGQRVTNACSGGTPLVIVVGGNERQAQAQADYPNEVAGLFGIAGEWVLADYSRPERPVEQIKSICARSGVQVVGILFSQRFNASNTKDDGQAFARSKCIHTAAPHITALPSAIEATRAALQVFDQNNSDNSEEG